MNAVIPQALGRSLLLAAVLAGGLGATTGADARKKKFDYPELMKLAEAEVSAGRIEPALARFNEAAQLDPTRKESWVRSAQLQFDAGNYGRAIVAAEEVLRRDPSDLIADSVLTVGGLRVASQSLQRLRSSGALTTSDSARREAEQLAATMRATLGDDILISDEQRRANAAAAERRKAAQRATKRSATARRAANNTPGLPGLPAPAASPAPPAKPKPTSANPFGVLGGN